MLSFPPNCNTLEKRTAYCYRAQELLRLFHNEMGWWHRGFDYERDIDGKAIKDLAGKPILDTKAPWTNSKWALLPPRIQALYPYKPKLTEAEWLDFKLKFEIFQDRIIALLLENRQLLGESTDWSVDMDSILEE